MRDSDTPSSSGSGQRGSPHGSSTLGEERPAPSSPPSDTDHVLDRTSSAGRDVPWSCRRNLRVLLVEDDPISGKLGALLMQQEGWEVTLVSTGTAALEAAEGNRYDVILTDVQMPDLDGFEVTRRLRAAEAEKGYRTSIIGLSAYCDPEDRECALRSGMDEYLMKPAAVGAVYAALERCNEGQARGEAPWNGPPPERPVAPGTRSIEIPGEVLVEWDRQLGSLKAALAAGDATALAKTAHAMNGGLAIFGARGASDVAHQLEKAARGAATETLSPLMARLESEVENLRRTLPDRR